MSCSATWASGAGITTLRGRGGALREGCVCTVHRYERRGGYGRTLSTYSVVWTATALQRRIGGNRLAWNGHRRGVNILQLFFFCRRGTDVVNWYINRGKDIKLGEVRRSAGVIRRDLGDTLW
jgi:hypothetical protein